MSVAGRTAQVEGPPGRPPSTANISDDDHDARVAILRLIYARIFQLLRREYG